MIWILGFDFWFLPNLFDESLGFVESFKPLYSLERTKGGQLPYRIGIAVAFFSFCWWAVTQPSDFDRFVGGQKDFIKDIYTGRLITDMSQKDKENIDKPKMPSLDELLKNIDEEEEIKDEATEEELVDSLLEDLVDKEDDFEGDEE